MKQTFLGKLWTFGQTHASGNLGCRTVALLHVQICHTLHFACIKVATAEPVLCVGFVLPLSSGYTHILKFIIIFFVRNKPNYIRLVTCLPQSYLIQSPGPAEFRRNWAKRLREKTTETKEKQSWQQQKDYVRRRDWSEDYVRRRDQRETTSTTTKTTWEDDTEEKRPRRQQKGRSFNFPLLCFPGFLHPGKHNLTPYQSDCRARGSNNSTIFYVPPART